MQFGELSWRHGDGLDVDQMALVGKHAKSAVPAAHCSVDALTC